MTSHAEVKVLIPSPIEEVADDRLVAAGVRLYLKRDDLIHPDIPGNKWRKLKYNLEKATRDGHRRLLTFGGAYSNHIRATAAVGHYFDFDTIGIIRGEEHLPLNPMLSDSVCFGMRLKYMDRTAYRNKNSPEVEESLRREFGDDFYLIPEGGSNALAVKGCAELPAEISEDFDLICCASGTGGTLAGIAAGLKSGQHALGFSALKGGDFLADEVAQFQENFGQVTSNWSVETNYHFGGFARRNPELDSFIAGFHDKHRIELEWVYVAKMLFGVFDLIAKERFSRGTTIVAVLTGPSYDSRLE